MSNLDPHQPLLATIKTWFRGVYGTDAHIESKEEQAKAMEAIGWMGDEAKRTKAFFEEEAVEHDPILAIEKALRALTEDLNQ